MLNRNVLLGTTVLIGLASASVAFAQTSPAKPNQPATQTASKEDGSEVEELIVTGSRIRRNEYTSASPIQVITSEQATLEGLIDTAEVLQQSSVASGSFQVNSQLIGTLAYGQEQVTSGANYISLRGLGANRTLVLLNGRRVGPAGVSGAIGPVDLAVIPQSIIARQEILKDGASSVYGSDAVAGVVNIITKDNVDGGAITVYGNQPFESGGERFQVNGNWGKTFDRGYIGISGDYYKRNPLTRGDRDNLGCTQNVYFDPTNGDRLDQRLHDGSYLCSNITNNAIQVVDNVNNRVLVYAQPGRDYGTAQYGNDSPYAGMARVNRAGYPTTYRNADTYLDTPLYAQEQVINPMTRYGVFLTGGFDLTSKTEVYGEFMYSRRETETNQISNVGPATVTSTNNGILGSTTGGLLASNPNNVAPNGTPFGYTTSVFIARTLFANQNVDYLRGVIGIKGELPELPVLGGWHWDAYVQRAKSDGEYNNQFIYTDRLTAVSGASACTNNPAFIGNKSGFSCANLNGGAGIPWTSQRVVSGQFNDQERAFLFGWNRGTTEYTQTTAEVSITGDLFTLPAGPLGAAFGVSWRKDEINDNPGENALARNMYNYTTAGITKGSDTVREAYGELDIPVFKSLPLVQSLNVNLSGRISDYESYGQSETYKVGVNWQIVPALRLRGSYGTSFRAPALFEQFIGARTAFQSQAIDPCVNYQNNENPVIRANCAGTNHPGLPAGTSIPENYTGTGVPSALVLTGGGRDVLKPETSDASMVGVIWTPSFIDLSVAVDYFEYDVKDEIRTFGAANILYQCYSRTDFPNNPYCSLFTRTNTPSATNYGVTQVDNSYVNVAAQKNRGIDMNVRYQHEFGETRMIIDGQFTWQLEDTTELLGAADAEDYNGSTTEPDFTGGVNVRFERGDWTLAWGVDMYGKASDTEVLGTDLASTNATYNVTCTFTPTPPPGGTSTPQVGACSSFRNTSGALATPGSLVVNSQPIYRKLYNEFTAYHNISITRRKDDWTFRAGIQNLFGEEAPLAGSGLYRKGTAALNLYDLLGRRGWISVTKTF